MVSYDEVISTAGVVVLEGAEEGAVVGGLLSFFVGKGNCFLDRRPVVNKWRKLAVLLVLNRRVIAWSFCSVICFFTCKVVPNTSTRYL